MCHRPASRVATVRRGAPAPSRCAAALAAVNFLTVGARPAHFSATTSALADGAPGDGACLLPQPYREPRGIRLAEPPGGPLANAVTPGWVCGDVVGGGWSGEDVDRESRTVARWACMLTEWRHGMTRAV